MSDTHTWEPNGEWSPTKELVIAHSLEEVEALGLTFDQLVPTQGQVLVCTGDQVLFQLQEIGKGDWEFPTWMHAAAAEWVPEWMRAANVQFGALRSDETNRCVLWNFVQMDLGAGDMAELMLRLAAAQQPGKRPDGGHINSTPQA